ncbi:hypothetical protein Salat_2778100 [Sesamum alatum]|uniref:Zinc knuckle CX2CX4HX4C domain-containing protein n=1 Tax=Sesamum alatum TaxID=300844 RepID=A0AAE1XLM1_9LAMI|nr:hypothetical protein Salat_2778100 [Sesamum alatum]
MDSFTIKMKRISYARILVEVDASKTLVDQVEFMLPNGVTRKQPVVYEFTPKFCTECNRFGHLKDSCQGTQPPAAVATTTPTATVKSVASKKAQPVEWILVKRRHKDDQKHRHNGHQLAAGNPKTAMGTSGSSYEPDYPTSTQHFMPRRFEQPKTETEAGRGGPSSLIMKIGFWNMRGFNRPLKHNGVAHLIKNNQLCLLGILETKLAASAIPRILSQSFPGWCQTNNFDTITGGRILII